jgi:hypothetical protein
MGISLARWNTAASMAAQTANTNTVASVDAFDHAAKVGCERGSESPIPVSPTMATLAGRTIASAALCTAGNMAALPKVTPTIPYCTSRDALAPAIVPTRTKTRASKTALPIIVRTDTPRAQV